MIPALLAAPMVQGVIGNVGGVVGGMINSLAPAKPSAEAPPFSAYIDRVARPSTSPAGSSVGIMRSEQWSNMHPTDLVTFANSLAGRHVDATDESGHVFSGTVTGTQQLGDSLALKIGGHLVSLSQLKQISWSPATV